jgi:hypothetical protein
LNRRASYSTATEGPSLVVLRSIAGRPEIDGEHYWEARDASIKGGHTRIPSSARIALALQCDGNRVNSEGLD